MSEIEKPNEFETSLSIINYIMNLPDEEENVYDLSVIDDYCNLLPRSITINKFVKSFDNINEELDKLLDCVSSYVNTNRISSNLDVTIKKLQTNVEFDYFKELLSDE